MKSVLKLNGVAFTQVNLSSVYIASVALTFQVDLVEENQSSSISQLNSFVSSSNFSHFSSYSVLGNGSLGGSVEITQAGMAKPYAIGGGGGGPVL